MKLKHKVRTESTSAHDLSRATRTQSLSGFVHSPGAEWNDTCMYRFEEKKWARNLITLTHHLASLPLVKPHFPLCAPLPANSGPAIHLPNGSGSFSFIFFQLLPYCDKERRQSPGPAIHLVSVASWPLSCQLSITKEQTQLNVRGFNHILIDFT